MQKRLFLLSISMLLSVASFVGYSNVAVKAAELTNDTQYVSTLKNVLEVGDVIFFGATNRGTDDEREIRWTVANVTNDASGIKYQLYAKNPVGMDKTFSDSSATQNWAESTLRAHMNGELYERSFRDEEKARILDTPLTSQSGDTKINTIDKLYLFSCADLTGVDFSDYKGQPTNPNHVINIDRFNVWDQYLRDVVEYDASQSASGSKKRLPLVYRRALNYYPIGEVVPDDKIEMAKGQDERLAVNPVVTINGDDLQFITMLDTTDVEQKKVCYRALNITQRQDGYVFFGKYSDGLVYKTIDDAKDALVLKVEMEYNVLNYVGDSFGNLVNLVEGADYRTKYATYLKMMTNKDGVFAFDGNTYPSLKAMLKVIEDRITREVFDKMMSDVSNLIFQTQRQCKGEIVTNFINQSAKQIDELDFSNSKNVQTIYKNALAGIMHRQKCQLLVNTMTDNYNKLAECKKYTLESINVLYEQYGKNVEDILQSVVAEDLDVISTRWATQLTQIKTIILVDDDNSIKNDNGFDLDTVFDVSFEQDKDFVDNALVEISLNESLQKLRDKAVEGFVRVNLTLDNIDIGVGNPSQIKIKLPNKIVAKDFVVMKLNKQNEYVYYECEYEDGYIIFNADCGEYLILAKEPPSILWATIPVGLLSILTALYYILPNILKRRLIA